MGLLTAASSAYLDTIVWLLDTSKFQPLIGVAVMAAGIFMVLNGEAAFKYMMILLSFLCVGATAHVELAQVWPAAWSAASAGEAALLAAAIMFQGYKGAKILMGTALGTIAALRVLQFTQNHVSEAVSTHDGIQFVICTACVALGVLAFTKAHNVVLGYLAPILGGLLVSSAVTFGVAATAKFQQEHGQASDITVQGSVWVEFLRALLSSAAPSVGVLGDKKITIHGEEHTIDMNRALGYAIWVVVALFGINVQKNARKANKAIAPGGLGEPLLG